MIRLSFQLSANARYAACLVGTERDWLAAECWSLEGPDLFRPAGRESIRTQPVPTDDGRLLLLRRSGLTLASPDGTQETIPVTFTALRLVPYSGQGILALAVSASGGRSTLWRVLPDPLRLDRVLELPGQLGATHRLGEQLGANLHHDGHTRPVTLDLTAGTWRDLPMVAGARTQHLLLADPSTGRLVVACDASGDLRLGHTTLDDPTRASFPAGLNAIEGAVRPLALEPGGRRSALRVAVGARTRLVIHDADRDTVTEPAMAAGSIHQVATWGADGIRFVHSTPDAPGRIVTLDPDRGNTVAPSSRTSVQRFHGPDDEFEAVCYGDWRHSRDVVVALHGGPELMWDLGFDPILHRLAEAGTAIVAPNQRGGIGYGAGHATAIHGAWGGPDLADIRALVRAIGAARPGGTRPMVYGLSYGAYLALLAAAADPELWSRCAVVAPFLSGHRLHAVASPPVRALINRLGGQAEVVDELGPRDLWLLAGRIRAELLVIHGECDETIPVGQARQLRDRLLAAGRREGADFTYLEAPGAGHFPPVDPAWADRLVGFLAPADPRPSGRVPPAPPAEHIGGEGRR